MPSAGRNSSPLTSRTACGTARSSARPSTRCTPPPLSSTWWTPSLIPNRFSLHEKSSDHHRRRLPRQSRARRLGRRTALQRIEERDLEFGETRSEEHTSELQSLRHLVC